MNCHLYDPNHPQTCQCGTYSNTTTTQYLKLLYMKMGNSNNIKNYGIYFRYLTRTDTVNMYKEYRSNTLCGAVSQLYIDLAGKHSGRSETVQIIRTSVLKPSELKRAEGIQFQDRSARFPVTDRRKRAPTQALRTTFKAERPTLM